MSRCWEEDIERSQWNCVTMGLQIGAMENGAMVIGQFIKYITVDIAEMLPLLKVEFVLLDMFRYNMHLH